jgi:hypothetical protein
VPGLDRGRDRLKDRALGVEQIGRIAARPVDQGELEQQVGADVADVLDRGLQPASRGGGARRRGRVHGALRALARLGALGGDQIRVKQASDGPVDHRLRDLPDPAEIAVWRRPLGDREAVGGLPAEDREHQPLRQRHLGKRRRGRSVRWLSAHITGA